MHLGRQTLFDSHPHPMWVYDLETLRILDVNAAALRKYGYDRDEFLSLTIADIRPEEDIPALRANVAAVTEGLDEAGIWRHRLKSGEIIHVDVTSHTVEYEGRRAELVTARDVTRLVKLERERAELIDRERRAREAAEAAARHFRALSEAAPGEYLVLDARDYRVVAVSDGYLLATGRSRASVRGRSVFDVLADTAAAKTPSTGAALHASLDAVAVSWRADVMPVCRHRLPRPTSEGGGVEERWWSAVNTPVFDADGELSFVIHRIEDVTEFVVTGDIEPVAALEERARVFQLDSALRARQLGAANARLEEQATKLRTAQRLLGLGFWRMDLARHDLVWSPGTCAIHGIDSGAAAPDFDAYVAMVHPDDRAEMREGFRRVAAGETADLAFRHRIVRPDGTVVHVAGIGELQTTEQGRLLVGVVRDLSREIEADKRLEEAAGLVTLARRMAKLGGWRVDLDAGLAHWSPETAAIHDLPDRRTMELDEAIDFYAPEDRERIRAVFDACAEAGKPFDEVCQLVTATGRRSWVRAVGEAQLDPAGRIVGVRGAFQDISELVAARNRSADLALRLQHTLETMTDAFYLVDREWRFAYLNTQAERLLHRGRDTLLGRHIWTEFPGPDAAILRERHEAAMASGQAQDFTLFFRPLETWFHVRVEPGPEGLAVYFHDVTANRERDAQLRLLETAVERMNDILVITEADPIDAPHGPKLVFVNEAFVRRTGYSRAEAIGRTPRILQGPDTRPEAKARIRQALVAGEPVQCELVNHTKAGERFFAELDLTPIDDDGRITHWLAIERDVTDRRAVEERLRQSQKLEAIGQLTGGVAHDFNNLLTVIMGNAEMLADQLEGSNGLKQLAEMTAVAAERGAHLTARLLAFARRQTLEPKVIDVDRLVADMQGLLRRTLPEHVEISVPGSSGACRAEVDPNQLEGALLNLAINARDAMPDGGKLTIETGNVRLDEGHDAHDPDIPPGDYVVVSVTDTGSGMSAEVAARVFEPFFTTKGVGKGSGLGLPMVYGFVKQSGGHARIYSEPGEGTCVKLYFPRAGADAAETAARKVPAGAVGGREHVLVVEDEPLVRRHVTTQLQQLGYRVTEAGNGPEALARLGEIDHVDLLLTDVVMPGGLNGRQLAEAAIAERPHLKVLYTSGYTQDAIVHHGRLDAGVHFLPKPFHRQDLAAKVRQAL
ncbi:MAG: PAS domain S-box protein, partial [Pseudomonadota bacterium]